MQTITIARSGSQPSSEGQTEYFTGSVRVDPPFSVIEPSRIAGSRVTFEPGARPSGIEGSVGPKPVPNQAV
jgi:quercetin dioxygenase-like cupin family protein